MNTNKRHSPGAPQSLMFPRCPHLKTSDISLPCHFTNLTKIFWANTVCLAMWCLGKTLGLEQYSWPLVDRGDRLLQHSKFSETVAPAMLRGHAIAESEPQSLNLSKLARRAVNLRRSEAEYNPDWRTELVSCWSTFWKVWVILCSRYCSGKWGRGPTLCPASSESHRRPVK